MIRFAAATVALSCVPLGGAGCQQTDGDNRRRIIVVTFNTGTSEALGHDNLPDDGYSLAHAALSDQFYGDGLAWIPAVEATTAFFAEVRPDIVAFQEIFYADECAGIPATAVGDFVCQGWQPGDPTVALTVLGLGYQVACHPGKPDKCLGVRRAFGTIRGCADDFCLEGLDGFGSSGCGNGARVGRAVIDLAGGGELTVVSFHGTSGLAPEDADCRRRQVDQVFVDLGDGAPGASGARNLILGDFNTDPGRAAAFDPSAARWNAFVGDASDFQFISDVGPDAEPTYAGFFNIDHVVTDAGHGSCWAAGVSAGHPDVIDAIYFDHKPVVCEIALVQPGR